MTQQIYKHHFNMQILGNFKLTQGHQSSMLLNGLKINNFIKQSII